MKAGSIFLAVMGENNVGAYLVLKDFTFAAEMEAAGIPPPTPPAYSHSRVDHYMPEAFARGLAEKGLVREIHCAELDLGNPRWPNGQLYRLDAALERQALDRFVPACPVDHTDCLAHPEMSAACGKESRDSLGGDPRDEFWKPGV